MKILVSGATVTVERFPEVGRLVSPRAGNDTGGPAEPRCTGVADEICVRLGPGLDERASRTRRCSVLSCPVSLEKRERWISTAV